MDTDGMSTNAKPIEEVLAGLAAEVPLAEWDRLKFAALLATSHSVNDARLTARMDAIERLMTATMETITNLTETGAELLDAMRTVVEWLEAVERQKCP